MSKARARLARQNLWPVERRTIFDVRGKEYRRHSLVEIPDNPKITFDHDTFTTTVEDQATFDLSTQVKPVDRVRQAFKFASPENWSRIPQDDGIGMEEGTDIFPEERFFIRSEPFRFTADNKREVVDKDQFKGPGALATHLRETSQWESTFGDGSLAGADIELWIIVDRRDEDIAADRKMQFKYRYGLHRCISYDIGPVSFGNILDVDDGGYEGTYDPDDNKLRVKTSKSIHFRAEDAADEDEIELLNFFSPAAASMLMRELTLEGTLRGLRLPPDPP